MNIIVEGIDRLGKSTLISGIRDRLGYFNIVHYQKPEKLSFYNGDLQQYQRHSFWQMFNMLSVGGFILDRSHLGEAVYAHRYREYSGKYIFQLEKDATTIGSNFANNTLLVLLTTSNFSFLEDDGLSLDFSKRVEEQADFKVAFEKSSIKNKIMIDVANGSYYRDKDSILEEVVLAYTTMK